MSLDDWPPDPVAEAETLTAEGRGGEAAAGLAALIEAGRGGLLARRALVRALIADGQRARAVEAARELSRLASSWAEGAVAFGQALIANGALPAGIAELQRALRLDPDSSAAELALAAAWADAGEATKAETHLERAAAGGAADPALITRLQAMREAKRADAGFVRHLFDQFSADYDERMRGKLGYRAPEILLELAVTVSGGALKKAATLDLGCGTGLAATAFKPFATTLTGIDLSPQMIAQADATGLYDKVAVADIEPWLETTKAKFSRVVAADVFVYLGDLTRVFAGVRRVLAPGGLFVFTTERHAGEEAFVLQETRRWAHSEAYLRQLAGDGFDLRGIVQCTPRFNAGRPIPGLACALARL